MQFVCVFIYICIVFYWQNILTAQINNSKYFTWLLKTLAQYCISFCLTTVVCVKFSLFSLNLTKLLFTATAASLEYLVVVEVNVSQVILIEQIKYALDSINLPVQLDNTIEINDVNFTTGKVEPPFSSFLKNDFKSFEIS